MNTNTNSYTIIYTTILVVFVAAVLAIASSGLKDKQQKNVDVEKQLSLLSAVGLGQDAAAAPDKGAYVEEEFSKYIVESYVVTTSGEMEDIAKSAENKSAVVNSTAFKVDMKEEFDLMKRIAIAPADKVEEMKAELKLPVFVCTLPSGETVYVVSCYGAGLWGPVWGYLALRSDFNTIYGAVFAHKSETPGLGAEIATPPFSDQFKNKEIFEGGKLTSVAVVKGGAAPGNLHEVDAISGGTITSNALDQTLKSWLEYYLPYFNKMRELAATPMPLTMAADSTVAGAAMVETQAEAQVENPDKTK